MGREKKIDYWLTSAEKDWQVVGHLFEKKDYPYALFFGHLVLEKLLKALFVSRHDEVPPFTHRLIFLAEKAGLAPDQDQLEILETVTDFNLEARYPDEKFSFHRRCTREFTRHWMEKIEDMRQWLLRQIK